MKRAFTLVEFLVCITMMLIIMGIAISIPMKKAKKTDFVQQKRDTFVCSCEEKECRFKIDNPAGKNEFFTIQLIGGGARGGDYTGGAAGETRIIHYPSMNGEYYIKLGEGGKNSSYNGGNTVLYKIKEDGKYEVLEFAVGGKYSNEQNGSDTITTGELPRSEIGDNCGAGGNKQQDGKDGGAVIKW